MQWMTNIIHAGIQSFRTLASVPSRAYSNW